MKLWKSCDFLGKNCPPSNQPGGFFFCPITRPGQPGDGVSGCHQATAGSTSAGELKAALAKSKKSAGNYSTRLERFCFGRSRSRFRFELSLLEAKPGGFQQNSRGTDQV